MTNEEIYKELGQLAELMEGADGSQMVDYKRRYKILTSRINYEN